MFIYLPICLPLRTHIELYMNTYSHTPMHLITHTRKRIRSCTHTQRPHILTHTIIITRDGKVIAIKKEKKKKSVNGDPLTEKGYKEEKKRCENKIAQEKYPKGKRTIPANNMNRNII